MMKNDVKKIAGKAIEAVTKFFDKIEEEDQKFLPPVLKETGTWIAQFDENSIGIFFLTKSERKRLEKNKIKGFNAFPGFIISESKKPPEAPVAVAAGGSCNYFSSNHTTNMFAFSVKDNASFTVVDHFLEIRDLSGESFKYHIDLVFVVGIKKNEKWQAIEKRILRLLNHTMEVWKKLQ